VAEKFVLREIGFLSKLQSVKTKKVLSYFIQTHWLLMYNMVIQNLELCKPQIFEHPSFYGSS
jgi:hypothetical protein